MMAAEEDKRVRKDLTPVGNFESDLEKLINEYGMENGSNTPDFILAQYMSSCLEAFRVASTARETWYGYRLESGRCDTPCVRIDGETSSEVEP